MVGSLATKTHKTMHYCDTDETMVGVQAAEELHILAHERCCLQLPLFERDEYGTASKSKYIMGKRNWTAVAMDEASTDLVFDIRVEYERGNGVTTGYVVLPLLRVYVL
jgi:hypothetical protein